MMLKVKGECDLPNSLVYKAGSGIRFTNKNQQNHNFDGHFFSCVYHICA